MISENENDVSIFRQVDRMELRQEKDGESLVIFIDGFLNVLTAPRLETVMRSDALDGVTHLVFDLSKTEYMSSIGLRIFLDAKKRMDERDGYIGVRGVNQSLMELFEMTGFVRVLNIEED